MENPVDKEYLQRPDKRNKEKKKGSDEEEEEEESEANKHLNRDKTPLYKKNIKEIKQFPFMTKYAGEIADDDEDDEYPANRNQKKNVDDSLGGGFGDF